MDNNIKEWIARYRYLAPARRDEEVEQAADYELAVLEKAKGRNWKDFVRTERWGLDEEERWCHWLMCMIEDNRQRHSDWCGVFRLEIDGTFTRLTPDPKTQPPDYSPEELRFKCLLRAWKERTRSDKYPRGKSRTQFMEHWAFVTGDRSKRRKRKESN